MLVPVGIAALVLLSSVLGCSSCDEQRPSSSVSSSTPDGETPREGDAPAEACPAAVPGTSVRALDIDGGAALEITTTADVDAVRARARVMAEHHGISLDDHRRMHRDDDPGNAAHGPARMGGELDDPGSAADAQRGLASISVAVDDIDGGVRILMVPRGAGGRDEVAAVRTHARRIAGRMADGRCPVMMM
jgi:hypothetical protein